MTDYVTLVCERCGNLRSVCSDPEVPWYPQRAVCYATAAAEQTWRRTHQMFESPKHDDPTPHVMDGSDWWASTHDLTPEDNFFGQAALVSGGQQVSGDEEQADHG